jgi:hypothetical protein
MLNWRLVGAWLSLVERLVRDQEVEGSNPSAPTNYPSRFQNHAGRLRSLAWIASFASVPSGARNYPVRSDPCGNR